MEFSEIWSIIDTVVGKVAVPFALFFLGKKPLLNAIEKIDRPKNRGNSQYVKRLENGNILLQSGRLLLKPVGGLQSTSVSLSCADDAFCWFGKFLAKTENGSEEYTTDGRTYKAARTPEGLFLTDVRGGNHSSAVGYTLDEVPIVSEEFLQCIETMNSKA